MAHPTPALEQLEQLWADKGSPPALDLLLGLVEQAAHEVCLGPGIPEAVQLEFLGDAKRLLTKTFVGMQSARPFHSSWPFIRALLDHLTRCEDRTFFPPAVDVGASRRAFLEAIDGACQSLGPHVSSTRDLLEEARTLAADDGMTEEAADRLVQIVERLDSLGFNRGQEGLERASSALHQQGLMLRAAVSVAQEKPTRTFKYCGMERNHLLSQASFLAEISRAADAFQEDLNNRQMIWDDMEQDLLLFRPGVFPVSMSQELGRMVRNQYMTRKKRSYKHSGKFRHVVLKKTRSDMTQKRLTVIRSVGTKKRGTRSLVKSEDAERPDGVAPLTEWFQACAQGKVPRVQRVKTESEGAEPRPDGNPDVGRVKVKVEPASPPSGMRPITAWFSDRLLNNALLQASDALSFE